MGYWPVCLYCVGINKIDSFFFILDNVSEDIKYNFIQAIEHLPYNKRKIARASFEFMQKGISLVLYNIIKLSINF